MLHGTRCEIWAFWRTTVLVPFQLAGAWSTRQVVTDTLSPKGTTDITMMSFYWTKEPAGSTREPGMEMGPSLTWE